MGAFNLVVAGLLPVVLAVFLYCAEKKTLFGKLPYMSRQIIIGVIFGLLAVFSTEVSIDIGGAGVNVRDAAPLTAGLLFGGPAGIIAGLIGAIERWFAALWGIGQYTRLACTLGTGMAGFLAAAVRKYLLDNKRASWMYGFAVGVTAEVLHMLLVFLTNMKDLHQAFSLIKEVAWVMILANGLSVMLAALCVSKVGKKGSAQGAEGKKIAQTFQLWLSVCVVIGFLITCTFAFVVQNRIAKANVEELLRINMLDIRNDIEDASDENLLSITEKIAEKVTLDTERETLLKLAEEYDVSEINIINSRGIISQSTYEEYIGFYMGAGEQSSYFMPLLVGMKSVVQDYQAIVYDSSMYRKYAGIALEGGGAVQVGYDGARFRKDIDHSVVKAAKNRHIGQDGCVIICDEEWMITSDRDGHEGELIQETGIFLDTKTMPENTIFQSDVYGVPSYCMYVLSEGYYIISMIPVEEAVFSRDVAVYVLVFMEILVFAALFAYIYFLIKKLVVENIQKVNNSLGEITGGNLDVVVNVRSNEEFASLSDDINSTVVTLKRYIDEAAARIDAELEFARTIQHSSLPSVFPPYPNRTDFDIYATMDTAKEVGGDFYDFYLINENELAFMVADVSGKGIPAAMFMMKAKTMIKSLAESGMDVAQIFTKANEYLCEGNDANMFVTGWIGILDLRTGHLTYANAGHNPPLIKRKEGNYEYLRTKPNFVLAGMEGVRYRKQELWLRPGDSVYLYTDGVTEAQDKDHALFGEERLCSCLNDTKNLNVEEICKKIKTDVDIFVGEEEQFDDMTMLIVKVKSLEQSYVVSVKPDQDSLNQVADFMDEKLEEFELPLKLCSKLKIVVDEIYSNIVYYSHATKAEVKCSKKDGKLLLVFVDDGIPYNPLKADGAVTTGTAEERPVGGLGIMIVQNLMDQMEYEYADGQNRLTLIKEI